MTSAVKVCWNVRRAATVMRLRSSGEASSARLEPYLGAWTAILTKHGAALTGGNPGNRGVGLNATTGVSHGDVAVI